MSHRVGALLMPAPAAPFGPTRPGEPNTAALDPALSILGQFFKAMLERYCGPAWDSIAPGEPVVRKLSVGFDPEDLDFSAESDTPLLALWRDKDGAPTRLTDGHAQSSTAVSVLWVPPPATEQVLAARSPIFAAFSATMKLAFENKRDPCWIRRGDEANVIARTYGSWVWGLAELDGWNYLGLERVPIVVATGSGNESFPGYLASWTILESTSNDPAAFGSTINGTRVGTEPTAIRFNLTDSTDDNVIEPEDALIRQTGDADFPPDT